MIVLDDIEQLHIEGTSKGNQTKFYNNGYWIKLDNQNSSEGIAEEFVSLFCDCIYDFPHVMYHTDTFSYQDNSYNGCYSYNMYDDCTVSFVSMRRLLRSWGVPLNLFMKEADTKQNIVNVVNLIEQKTCVNTLNYFRQLLLLDALIINEDRHIMNLGLCLKNNSYMLAPVFDNGSSLFCINWTYRKTKTLEQNIDFAKSVARPFSKFYDKQVDAILQLTNRPLLIDKRKVDYLLQNYYNKNYNEDVNSRIKAVLKNRLLYYNGKAFVYV